MPACTPDRSLIRVPDIATQATAEVQAGQQYNHILTCIMDANPFLGEGSKQAISTAGMMAGPNDAKVTLLLIEEPGTKTQDPEKQMENLTWHLHDKGCRNYAFISQETTQPASVLVGDKADEVEADLVVLSSEAIHAKYVDANQLAEFVSCPLLIVP
uniref:UspA domain-containing protein n=1 Tax=Dunaliella tertiolecta TaxID=3047 RepID=A0A7S3VNP1_DUNTE